MSTANDFDGGDAGSHQTGRRASDLPLSQRRVIAGLASDSAAEMGGSLALGSCEPARGTWGRCAAWLRALHIGRRGHHRGGF